MKFAVIKTGGKQYVVSENDEIVVDNLDAEENAQIELEKLAEGDFEKEDIEVGTPVLKTKVTAKVLENFKGDKIRVARFKAKTRQRKVKGHRQHLSRIKITKI